MRNCILRKRIVFVARCVYNNNIQTNPYENRYGCGRPNMLVNFLHNKQNIIDTRFSLILLFQNGFTNN